MIPYTGNKHDTLVPNPASKVRARTKLLGVEANQYSVYERKCISHGLGVFKPNFC